MALIKDAAAAAAVATARCKECKYIQANTISVRGSAAQLSHTCLLLLLLPPPAAAAAAAAVTAEVGHTMGLDHDGTTTVAYYNGQGDWAPVSSLLSCGVATGGVGS
jgi:hypothetical protein